MEDRKIIFLTNKTGFLYINQVFIGNVICNFPARKFDDELSFEEKDNLLRLSLIGNQSYFHLITEYLRLKKHQEIEKIKSYFEFKFKLDEFKKIQTQFDYSEKNFQKQQNKYRNKIYNKKCSNFHKSDKYRKK